MLLEPSAAGRLPLGVVTGSGLRFQSREDYYYFHVDQLLWTRLHSAAGLEETLAGLACKTTVSDRHLLTRIAQADFDATNVDVLLASPLAFVAWASGDVSDQEAQAAELAFRQVTAESDLSLLDQFRAFLTKRPDPQLWTLWGDFYRAYRRTFPRRFRRPMDELMFRSAHQVALASGGLLGFGRVCEEEKFWLVRLQEALEERVDASPLDSGPLDSGP